MPSFMIENDQEQSDPKKKAQPPVRVTPTQADHNDANPVTDTPSPLVVREGGYTPSPVSPYITPNLSEATATPTSIVQRMLDVQFYAPNLANKPGMTTAIALDPRVSRAEIRQIAALELAVSRRLEMESYDTQAQMDKWAELDAATQRSLLAVGFVPGAVGEAPAPQKEDGGVWGWLKSTHASAVTALTPSSLEDEALGWQDGFYGAIEGTAGAVGDAGSWVKDTYNSADDATADKLTSMGITDSVIGDVGGAVSGGLKAAGGTAVDWGTTVLSAPQDYVFRNMRAFRILQDRDDLSFGSISDIDEAFRIAEDGNKSYDNRYLAIAKDKIGDETLYGLALEVNSLPEEERAAWVAQKVEDAGKTGDQAAMVDMYATLQSSKFANAMDLVDGAHISFGRMVAQDYRISDAGEDDFHNVSGALDLTARITLDPWLLAGAATKGIGAFRYGISLGKKVEDAGAFATRVDEIMKLKTTRRFWEGTNGDNGAIKLINTLRNSDDPAAIADATRRLKRYNGLDDAMTQALVRADRSWKFENADDVANFIKGDINGKAAVFSGKAAFRLTKLQKKNMLEHALAQVKPGKVTDWLDMKAGLALDNIGATRGELGLTDDMIESGGRVNQGALRDMDELQRAEAVTAGNKAMGSIINNRWQKSSWYRANTMLTRLTTKVPVPKDGKLYLNGPDAVAQVNALARTFGPRAWSDNVTAAFAVSNEVGRRQIYRGLMESLGEASGMNRTAEGRQIMEEYTSRAVDTNYVSATGADTAGDGAKVAILAGDLRPYVSMPEYSLLHAQAQRMGVLSKLGGHFTKDGYDWFIQRAFKPSVLLRPALVLRNAGEEVLRHVVDNGPRSYLTGRIARTHLRSGAAREGGFVDPSLYEEWRFFRLFTKPAWKTYEVAANTVLRGGRGTASRHAIGRNTRDWFVGGKIADLRRGFLSKNIGEDTLKTLEDMWDNDEAFRRMYAKEVMESSRKAYVGVDSSPRVTAGLQSANRFTRRSAASKAQTVQFKARGGFEPKAVEGHEGAVRWTLRLDKLAHDDFSRIAFENLLDEDTAIRLLKEELETNPLSKTAAAMDKFGLDTWARNIFTETKHHFVGQNGKFQQKLYDHLVPDDGAGLRRVDSDAFDIDKIDELVPSVDDRPLHVLGQDIVHIERDTPGLIARLIDGGFDYIGESTNYISRGPLFFANMIDSLRDTRALVQAAQEAGIPTKVIEQARRNYAKKVYNVDGAPVTLHLWAPERLDRIGIDAVTDGDYGVGTTFVEKSNDIEDLTQAELRRELQTPGASGEQFFDYKDFADGHELIATKALNPDRADIHTVRVIGPDNDIVAVRDFKVDPANPRVAYGGGTTVDPKARFRATGISQNHRMYDWLASKFDEVRLTPFQSEGRSSFERWISSRRKSFHYEVVDGKQQRVDVTHDGTKFYTHEDDITAVPGSDQYWSGAGDLAMNRLFRGMDDIDPMMERARELTRGRSTGHVHSVWVKGKVLDVSEDIDPGKFERMLRSFAKAADLGDEFVQGQLSKAKAAGRYRVDDFYRAGRAAAPESANEALASSMKTARVKAFRETDDQGRAKVHVLDEDSIVADKYPTAPGATESKWAQRQYRKVAQQRALERTIAFVDNPIQRSQFSVIARNLFPFWRAQEEFYRRWARTFKHSPESFRKAQLMMMGFEHSGFVQKDDSGHAYFVYPYIGEATEAFRKFGERLGMDFGGIPQVTQYSGQIRFLNQGIDPNNIQPAVSPLLGFPVSILAGLYPEMQSVENVVLGEQGAGRNPFEALLPTPVRRLVEAGVFNDDPGAWSAQMLSSGQSAVAALEAAGLTPPDDASPAEVDAYIERVRAYTKFTLGFRAVWGAIAPTPLDQLDKSAELPEHLQFDGVRTIDQLFMNMVEEMGYEKAIVFWAAANPDQIPFTTSKTESASGAYWNSTEKAGAFYEKNKGLFEKFPRAATFLFPLDPTGEWSPDVFATEMANGLRTRKDMGTFYRDLKLNGKLTEYYESKDNVDSAVAEAKAVGDYTTAAVYEDSYGRWEDKFLKQNPLVDEYINFGQPRAYEREGILTEMKDLLKVAPESPATTVISDLVESYDNYQKYLAENPGSTAAAELNRKLAESSWREYMETTAKTDDNAWLFYNRTFRYME